MNSKPQLPHRTSCNICGGFHSEHAIEAAADLARDPNGLPAEYDRLTHCGLLDLVQRKIEG